MKKLVSTICAIILLIPTTAAAQTTEVTEHEITMIAKTMYMECRSNKIPTVEKAAVAWCILNRVDCADPEHDHSGTISQVITRDSQFAWDPSAPVLGELYAIAQDVVLRWQLEKIGAAKDVGRVLPKEYCFFAGRDDGRNYFRTDYEPQNGIYWGWGCPDPYKEEVTVP